MEELVIPKGKQLRYRCKIRNCSSTKTFSLVSIMDHLALHFDKYLSYKSGKIFNYYCNLCKVPFYALGMCAGCKCQPSNSEEQFVLIKSKVTMEDIRREAHFFVYVHKNAVPVLENVTNTEPHSTPKTVAGGERPSGGSHNHFPQGKPLTTPSERGSRPADRRQPHGNIQFRSVKRPNPPPLPRRKVSRSPDRKPQTMGSGKTSVENGQFSTKKPQERRSRSTVRRPPVKSRQECLLTENPPPHSVSRRQSRSPAPRSRVTRTPAVLVEQEDSNDLRSSEVEREISGDLRISGGADAWKTMPSPSQYPDGSSRTPRYDDDEEEIEPAYFRAVRSRSQSRCRISAMADGDENGYMAPKTNSNDEGKACALWNVTLWKPERFSNVFSEEQLSSSSMSSTANATGIAAGPFPPKKDIHAQKTAQLQTLPPVPEVAPPPPPPTDSPPDEVAEPSPPKPSHPPPPPEEDVPDTASDGYYRTTVSDPSALLPPPPPPPPPSSLGAKQSESSRPLTSKCVSLAHVQKETDARNHPSSTVRTLSKRSRQDALLEENPPPPRSPRRKTSRSPGPRAPLCSSNDRQFGSITPAHRPHASSANGGRTFGCVSQSITMDFDASCDGLPILANATNMPHCFSPSFNGFDTPAFGSTPHYTSRTPVYCPGSPDYENDSRTLYGGRTPSGSRTHHIGRTPTKGAETPYYEPRTPIFTDRSPCCRTPDQGPSTPYYDLGTPGRSPGTHTSSYTPSSPSFELSTPAWIQPTASHGSRTPLYEPSSSSLKQISSTVNNSSESHGANTGMFQSPPPPPLRPQIFGLSQLGLLPPGFPSLHETSSLFVQHVVAPHSPVHSIPQSGSVQAGPNSTTNPSSAITLKLSEENLHSTTTGISKKCAPPQRAGGSVFLDTPPPTKKLEASYLKSKKENAKRKRRRSYDRSDSD